MQKNKEVSIGGKDTLESISVGNVESSPADSEFIMKPKIDVAFKMLFGEESHRSLLSSWLSAIMDMPRSTFAHLEYLNLELSRFHINDKLGVLDVRVRTEDKKEINIEIQLASYLFMAKRSLFYWGKLFTSQMQVGDNYGAMEKCIVINLSLIHI